MKIAVQSPNWIGDCVMCLPALRALKFYFPKNRIYLICRAYLRDIFLNVREIDEIVPVSDRGQAIDIVRISRILKPYRFHQGILFTNSFRSALIFRLAGIKDLLGYQKDLRGMLLSRKLKFPRSRNHHAFFYLDLIETLAGNEPDKNSRERPEFSDEPVIDNQEKKKVERILRHNGINPLNTLVGISPAAAYGGAKEWLPDRFAELNRRVLQHKKNVQILLFGSEREVSRVSAIWEKSGPGVFNLAGKLTLREAMVSISFCSLFISNDSGMMHVASSLKLPVIGLFGPTVPEKTAPRNPESHVIDHQVDCAPCLYRECPRDHRCMTAIQVEDVLELTMNLLSKSSGLAYPPAGDDRKFSQAKSGTDEKK
jgi:heptosyltransferase-2